jgi:ABC-2 type transport system ATP-binding protein
MTSAIHVQQLSKYYGDFTAIADLSFEVQRGSVTAFLGPNGAGKSTTLKIITGFLAASSGTAHIEGMDVAEDRLAISQILGYLPENGPLYRDMTAASFLHFIAQVRGMSKGDEQAAIERVVTHCRLAEVWHKSIAKLSKGFRQRIGLAQAIMHKPKVLILDEPTAGLDPNQILLVRELISSLKQESTILLSTHILQEVQAMADHVVLISDGRLRFDGSPESMCAEGEMDERFHSLTGGDHA